MRLCIIEGCGKKHRRNGFCRLHSHRLFRQGDPLKIGSNKIYFSEEDRKAAIKRSQRAYDKSPKGKAASVLKRHRRRHREGGEVQLTVTQVLVIMIKFNRQCFKCKTYKDLTLDHHIPLTRGGHLTPQNCVILCRRCNGLKAGQVPEVFYSKDELAALAMI